MKIMEKEFHFFQSQENKENLRKLIKITERAGNLIGEEENLAVWYLSHVPAVCALDDWLWCFSVEITSYLSVAGVCYLKPQTSNTKTPKAIRGTGNK